MFQELLPLEMLRSGESAEVMEVHGESGWIRRLAELGLRSGSQLKVLQPGRPCLIQIGESRLSLRGEDLMQIYVRPNAFAS